MFLILFNILTLLAILSKSGHSWDNFNFSALKVNFGTLGSSQLLLSWGKAAVFSGLTLLNVFSWVHSCTILCDKFFAILIISAWNNYGCNNSWSQPLCRDWYYANLLVICVQVTLLISVILIALTTLFGRIFLKHCRSPVLRCTEKIRINNPSNYFIKYN